MASPSRNVPSTVQYNYIPQIGTQVKTYKKVHVRIRRLSDRPVVLPATAAVGFWRETPINRYR